MEKTNEVNEVKFVGFTDEEKKTITLAAYSQCIFIFFQVLLFPTLGMIGSILSALCAMMPWLPQVFKKSPQKAFSMVVASICLSPLYAKFCIFIIAAV